MCAETDPDTLDTQDWHLLQASDLERRARRRWFDGDDREPVRDLKATPERYPAVETSALKNIPGKETRGRSQDTSHPEQWMPSPSAEGIAPDQQALDVGVLDEDVSYDETDAEEPTFEWHDLLQDADEFDESPTRNRYAVAVRIDGKVSARERAEQVATELGLRFGWDSSEIQLLTELFDVRYWGSTRSAIERLLTIGATPDEIEVAIQLREFWNDRSEFGIDLGRVSWWAPNSSSSYAPIHRTLSWPAALRLVRVTTALPDIAEMGRFLDDLYAAWYCSGRLRHAFCSFNYYFLHWLDYMEAHPELRNMWLTDFEAQVDAHDPDHDEKHYPGYTTPANQRLDQLGLLPLRTRRSLDEQLQKR